MHSMRTRPLFLEIEGCVYHCRVKIWDKGMGVGRECMLVVGGKGCSVYRPQHDDTLNCANKTTCSVI